MGWIDTLRELFTPPAPERVYERAAPNVVPEMNRLGAYGNYQWDGSRYSVRQIRQAYVSTVFFLAGYRARIFARHLLQLTVQRRLAQNEYEDIDPDNMADGARLWVQLLQRPNDYMSPLAFWQWVSLNRDLTRGAHMAVEYQAAPDLGVSVPRYLHPIYAEDGPVSPQLNGVGEVTGWTHHRSDGIDVAYAPEEIIRIGHDHPVHRGRGASLIEAAAYEIDHSIAARVYARDQAQEQGLPDVILEADDMLQPAEGNRISRDFAGKYRAGARRHSDAAGVPWTAGGLKAKPMTLNAKDMQFLELAVDNEERLWTVFEVQKSLFSDEAYATGQQGAQRGFAVNTVQPNVDDMADRIEFEMERIFRADRGALRIQAPNTVPVDEEQRANIDQVRIETGTPINRVLQERGEDPVEGGDVPLVSSMLQPLDMAAGMG